MHNKNSAFTLVELLVALALFSVVALISIGALLSVVDANARAQASQSVMNNLNIAIDGMMRSVRMGQNFRCGSTLPGSPQDCANPEESISFLDKDKNWRAYFLQNGRIFRRACESGSSNCSVLPITAPSIEVTRFDIYVAGAQRTLIDDRDTLQPTAVFIIEGLAGSENLASTLFSKKKKNQIKFRLQTVATQRLLDI